MRLVGLKIDARMRLEHHDAGAALEAGGDGAGFRQQGLMATMDAVEVANRDDAAAGIEREMVEAVNDVHGTAQSKADPLAAGRANAIVIPA